MSTCPISSITAPLSCGTRFPLTLLVELTRPAGELTVLDTRVDILLSRDQILINNQFRITLATAQITLATDRSREIARETKWGGSLP